MGCDAPIRLRRGGSPCGLRRFDVLSCSSSLPSFLPSARIQALEREVRKPLDQLAVLKGLQLDISDFSFSSLATTRSRPRRRSSPSSRPAITVLLGCGRASARRDSDELTESRLLLGEAIPVYCTNISMGGNTDRPWPKRLSARRLQTRPLRATPPRANDAVSARPGTPRDLLSGGARAHHR